jgi:5-methylcytosine-specific restriction endonuclease McrBC regulatory subunit McrC
MIRKAREGEITWLPGIRASDIPYPLPNGVRVLLQGETLGLEAQGVVGAIPFRNGDTLQIIPKVGKLNFLRLLFRAEGNQRDLERSFNEFVEYSIDDEETTDGIVARHLLYCAEEILKRSPKRGRVSRHHVGLFAAGRIELVATALNVAAGKEEPVAYLSKDKTEDIAENRVITEAIMRIWPILNEINRQDLRSVYDRWTRRFPRSPDLGADLHRIERRFAARGYGGFRDYYRKALMVSQIVLGSNGIGFGDAGSIGGEAVLINTADVFEKYLRSVISDAYSDSGYVVTKGGVGTASLYTDGSFELVPDIVIDRGRRTLLIADAKYKVPTAADHYQMAAYLAVNRVSHGLLLSPHFGGDTVVVREYATSGKVVVREAYLPMEDLEATEKFLGTVIERFAS